MVGSRCTVGSINNDVLSSVVSCACLKILLLDVKRNRHNTPIRWTMHALGKMIDMMFVWIHCKFIGSCRGGLVFALLTTSSSDTSTSNHSLRDSGDKRKYCKPSCALCVVIKLMYNRRQSDRAMVNPFNASRIIRQNMFYHWNIAHRVSCRFRLFH